MKLQFADTQLKIYDSKVSTKKVSKTFILNDHIAGVEKIISN